MAEYIEKEAALKLLEVEERYGYLDAGDIRSIPAVDVIARSSFEAVGKKYAQIQDKLIRGEIAPVTHGRWEEWWPPKHMILTGEEMLYRCSVCDAKYSDKENMLYCPHCGAKMDLEV